MAGDEIHSQVYKKEVADFSGGGLAFLRKVDDVQRYAVPVYKSSKLVRITEKPAWRSSKRAVCGPLMFDASVFDKIKKLRPSARDETELVDLYQKYIDEGSFQLLNGKGYYEDMGTFESLAKVSCDVLKNKIDFKHDYI